MSPIVPSSRDAAKPQCGARYNLNSSEYADLDTDDTASSASVSSFCRHFGRLRAYSESTGLDLLKSYGSLPRSREDFKLDSGSAALEAASNETTLEAESYDEETEEDAASTPTQAFQGEYVPMWCRMQRRDEEISVVMPCVDEVSLNEAHEMGEALYLWCWAHPDGSGGTILAPCTEREPPASHLEPPSASEVACVPEPAPPGSYRPPWFPGPTWPFNALPTTLVLSELPQGLSQESLLEVLDRLSFCGFYDFVHLAFDPATEQNYGAVVNLLRHEYALSLAAKLHGRTHWNGEAAFPCQVRWSLPLQGLEDLMHHYRNHPWNSEAIEDNQRPQLFTNGWPAPLPASPTSEGCKKFMPCGMF